MLRTLLLTPFGRVAARLVLMVAILLVWQFAPASRATQFWLSRPADILATLWGCVLDGSIWIHLEATLIVMAAGYVLGSITGIGIGFLFGFMPRLYRVLAPYVAAFYALPKIALAPLFVILLGIGFASKIVLVAITVFFLVLNSTVDGVRDVDRDLAQSLTLMGATRSEIIRKVLVWAALPWIFTGMRIAVRYAFTNTLLAELIASNRGIGFLIQYASGNFDATSTYAAITVLVLFSVVLTECLTRVEHVMSHWRT
jgi:NitT/TauT family transport system permease protein